MWADKLLTFREAILKPRFDGRRIFEVDSCFVETNWYKLDWWFRHRVETNSIQGDRPMIINIYKQSFDKFTHRKSLPYCLVRWSPPLFKCFSEILVCLIIMRFHRCWLQNVLRSFLTDLTASLYLSFRGVNSVIKILNSPDDFTVIGKSTIASATSLIL